MGETRAGESRPARVLATCIAIVLRIAPIGDIDVDATSIVWRIVQALALAVQLNVFLALFNMVPVPPLDGGNVLAGLLTGPMARAFDQLRPWGFLILYGLMLTGVLWTIIDPPASLLLSWLL
jgi:Zn-dependent protease